MSSFVTTLLFLALLSWTAFILLLVKCRKKNIRMTKNQSWKITAITITLFGVLAYCAVFEDQDFIFDCRHETNQCEYFRSTFVDKELRLSKTYDISRATGVSVKEHYHRRRSGYKDYYYKVAVNTTDGGFEMPHEFPLADFAREEASILAAFFAGKRPFYHYEQRYSKGANEVFMIMGAMFTFMIGMAGCLICAFNLRGASQNKKKRKRFPV